MSDTSQIESPTPQTTTPTAPTPLPNDQAARSPTGEILEPSQIPPTTQTTPEAKPDGTQDKTSTPPDPKAEDKDKPKPAPTTGAPETYADFKAPEGYTLDQAAIKDALPIFKELGLTQDQAQKLVEFHSQQMIAAAKAPQSTYEALRTEWRGKVSADTEITGYAKDGKTGLDAVKVDIGKALVALNDPQLAQDFKDGMNLTGAGDHPAFIKAFWKLSQFVTEGTHVKGSQPSPHGQRPPGTSERPSAAAALFPNLR